MDEKGNIWEIFPDIPIDIRAIKYFKIGKVIRKVVLWEVKWFRKEEIIDCESH